jgi:uncharacterized protein (TIGR04141 family)
VTLCLAATTASDSVPACASATNAAQNPASFFERAIADKPVGPASHAQAVHGRTLTKQRSPGAVLFIQASGRLFAATFGYGRSLLAPEKLVQDFGIRCVLNSVNPAQLRSIDLRTLETDPLLSRKQFGEGKPIASFGVDVYRDLLRGVAGIPADKSPLMSGADALHVRLTLADLSALPAECTRLLTASEKRSYKANFGFIDHVRLVRDAALRTQLFNLLHLECQQGAKGVNFVTPHVREPDRLSRLRGSWDKNADDAVDTDGVRSQLAARGTKPNADAFLKAIKTDRIGEPSPETDELTNHWPLLDGLVWSTTLAGKRFVLSVGDWFELDGAFVASVETRFDKIVSEKTRLAFPAATNLPGPKKSYFEQRYNAHAAAAMNLHNLDRSSMTTGVASAVEPCDLLDAKRGTFIHVKDGRKSSILSHLFEQGTVSLETFLSVDKARKEVRKRAGIKKTGSVLCEPITPGKLTVVFAIVDRAPKSGPWRLPFFSMLAAQHAADRIGERQASLRIVRIDDRRP